MKLIGFSEAASDHRVLAELIDRVLRDQGPSWVGEALDSAAEGLREWYRDPLGRPFFDIKQVDRYAKELAIGVVHGHFDGKPGLPDALTARTIFRIVRVLQERDPDIEGVVVMRDMDDEPAARRAGLTQAREEAERFAHFAIILGCPNAMREAWALAGYEPADDDEAGRLAAVRQQLGFSPIEKAHELTAADETAKRSAKRVLRFLTGGDHDREERCWSETPLETLRERSAETGLREFLDEIEQRLIPRVLKP